MGNFVGATSECPPYKASLRPNAFVIPGVMPKPGTMVLEKIIGQFLKDKGIADTEDYCTYTIGTGIEDFDLEFDQASSTLSLTVDGTTDTVVLTLLDNYVVTSSALTICGTIYPSGTTLASILGAYAACAIQTENGISGDGSSGDKIRLGGTLNQNTSIDGVSTYTMGWANLIRYTITTDGASAQSSFVVSGLKSDACRLQHTDKADPTKTSILTVDVDSDFGIQYQDSNGEVGFLVSPDPAGANSVVKVVTQGIRDGTLSNGWVLKLIDNTTGEAEFQVGSITIPGAYDDDADAAVNGVAVGNAYYVSGSNPWGMSQGFVRVREV